MKTYASFLCCAVLLLVASCRSSQGLDEKNPATNKAEQDLMFKERFFAAQAYKARGDVQKAYSLFQEAAGFQPEPAVLYEMARVERVFLKNPAAAFDHIKVAVASDKQNPWYQHELGMAYMDLGKYDLASKAFAEVARLNPADPASRYDQATALLMANKTKEAIAIYDQLEKETGPFEELSFQKHQLYIDLKDYDKAGLELEKLALAYPEEPKYWGYAADFYQKGGQKEKAKYALEQMKKIDPNNGLVHFQLSQFYAADGDNAKSYDELKLAFQTKDLTIDEKIGVLLRYYSLVQMQPEYLSQAHELIRLTVELHPEEAKIHSMKGDFLVQQGKLQEALLSYERAVSLDPSKSQIWDQVIRLQGNLERFSDMISSTEKALELFPNNPEFYLFNGLAHSRNGNAQKAVDAFLVGKELVVDNLPLQAEFYASLGSAYNSLQLYSKSDEAYEQCLILTPENALVLNNYAYYLAIRKSKLDKALELTKRCNELAPNEPNFQDTYAWVLYQRAEYAEALIWMTKVMNSGKAGADEHEHYGDILYRLNRTSEAVNSWKTAQTMGKTDDSLQQKISTQKISD